MDIIATVPKSTPWETYEIELEAAKFGAIMRFKVSSFPKKAARGDRFYVVWNGAVRGWMTISGFFKGEFTCSTTGRKWSGKFIERTGVFHRIGDYIPHSGFQGWRYYDPNNLNILESNKENLK